MRIILSAAIAVSATQLPILAWAADAGSAFRDAVEASRTRREASAAAGGLIIPEERQGRPGGRLAAPTKSVPLHLAAHEPGQHYFRFPDMPARNGTRMRLSFWYLNAVGNEGPTQVRVTQYHDTPSSWKMLNEAGFEVPLKVVGRWTRFEKVFTTDAECTTLGLDFRIASETDIGEAWIADVSLEPVGRPAKQGP